MTTKRLDLGLDSALDIANSEFAADIASSLEGGFQPLVVGNCVFIPKRHTTIAEIAEVSGVDEELIFDHPSNAAYYVIECPEGVERKD